VPGPPTELTDPAQSTGAASLVGGALESNPLGVTESRPTSMASATIVKVPSVASNASAARASVANASPRLGESTAEESGWMVEPYKDEAMAGAWA